MVLRTGKINQKNLKHDSEKASEAANTEEYWGKTGRKDTSYVKKFAMKTSKAEIIDISSEDAAPTDGNNDIPIGSWHRGETVFAIKTTFNAINGYLVDLASLTGREWANDHAVIAMIMIYENKYQSKTRLALDSILVQTMETLSEKENARTFCLNEAQTPALRKVLKEDVINEMIIPICTANHWFVAVLNSKMATLTFYDSLRCHTPEGVRIQIKEAFKKANVLPNTCKDLEIIFPIVEQQEDGFLCGTHAAARAEEILSGIPQNYTQEALLERRINAIRYLLNTTSRGREFLKQFGTDKPGLEAELRKYREGSRPYIR